MCIASNLQKINKSSYTKHATKYLQIELIVIFKSTIIKKRNEKNWQVCQYSIT